MFYIGFRDIDHAQIGIARSSDGITAWQRHPANPIVRSGTGKWDDDACYKPYAIFDGRQWLLWYNGRRQALEQIGVAIHEGEDLDDIGQKKHRFWGSRQSAGASSRTRGIMPGRNEEHAHIGGASSRTRRTLLVSPPQQLAGELPVRAQDR